MLISVKRKRIKSDEEHEKLFLFVGVILMEEDLENDLEYIKKVQNGEKEAFNEIIKKYYKQVLNLVCKFYGQEKEEAEDITQEVFLRLYRGIKGFEGRSAFFTYLYKITMNLCFKKLAVKKRKSSISIEEFGDHDSAVESRDLSVEMKFQQKEIAEAVRKAVSMLPADQRAVVILNRFNGLSYDEISSIMGISLSAVKSRLHRAKMSLKEELSQYALELY